MILLIGTLVIFMVPDIVIAVYKVVPVILLIFAPILQIIIIDVFQAKIPCVPLIVVIE
jgi:hypothetical protein